MSICAYNPMLCPIRLQADSNYADLVVESLPEVVDLMETFAIRFPGDLELAQLTDLLISKWFQED